VGFAYATDWHTISRNDLVISYKTLAGGDRSLERENLQVKCSETLNVEQQNKEPQNYEVPTSIFPPEADSIFCGLN
jgi:hypothetical protein